MKLTENAGSGWILKAVGCGGVAVVTFWIISLTLGGMLGSARIIGQSNMCQSNVINMTRGFAIYAEDNEGYLPRTERWMDHLQGYIDREARLHCPTVSHASEPTFGYAMANGAAYQKRSDDTRSVVLIFDSTNTTRNAAGEETLKPIPGRHRGRMKKGDKFKPGNVVGLIGGSVKFVPDGAAP
ncbi:MAG: hypothetical protein ABJA67_11460 [Chthonomonadales bacterium]